MTVRYGILSVSSIAPRFLAAVGECPGSEVLAVSSRGIEKARELAQAWQIPRAYGSHPELLADPQVNAVYISNVNSAHYPWAKQALLAGKHVICEKPCTTCARHTQELFDLARERGLFLMEAQKMLFLPTIREVRRRIEAGELGNIEMARLSHSFSADYNTWMFDQALGGGPLLSSGIYAVELMRWLFGPLRELKGVKSSLETGVEYQYVLSGRTQSGVVFTAANSTRTRLENTALLYGTLGWVEIPEYWKARQAVLHFADGTTQTLSYPCQHELVYEVRHIQECLEQGLLTSPVVTPQLSLDGISALEQIKAGW